MELILAKSDKIFSELNGALPKNCDVIAAVLNDLLTKAELSVAILLLLLIPLHELCSVLAVHPIDTIILWARKWNDLVEILRLVDSVGKVAFACDVRESNCLRELCQTGLTEIQGVT